MIGKVITFFNTQFQKLHLAVLENRLKLNDIQASLELAIIEVGFIPKSSYSMSPVALLHVINEIVINNRRVILEVGTGVSTVYIAKVARDLGLELEIISIDENPDWQNTILGYLKKLGCEDIVRFCHSGIDEASEYGWYQEDVLSTFFAKNSFRFDCIIIDAPSTHNHVSARSRAIPFLMESGFIQEEYAIYLDDTYRSAEKKIANDWKALLQCKLTDYVIYTELTNGNGFVSRPILQGHKYRMMEYDKVEG
tara:strand:- start:72381 stop:73136 length:756 start_codon:yes stop_codon:yes gene_type:complete